MLARKTKVLWVTFQEEKSAGFQGEKEHVRAEAAAVHISLEGGESEIGLGLLSLRDFLYTLPLLIFFYSCLQAVAFPYYLGF